MAEAVTLAAPVTVSRTKWILANFDIDALTKTIVVVVLSDDGRQIVARYPTPPPASNPSQPAGAVLLTALNTADLTSNSLIKRIFTRLIADGYLTGSVTGTPD